MVFLKEFFEIIDFEKKSAKDKKARKIAHWLLLPMLPIQGVNSELNRESYRFYYRMFAGDDLFLCQKTLKLYFFPFRKSISSIFCTITQIEFCMISKEQWHFHMSI